LECLFCFHFEVDFIKETKNKNQKKEDKQSFCCFCQVEFRINHLKSQTRVCEKKMKDGEIEDKREKGEQAQIHTTL
jgi:hypothetical protein